MSTTLYKRSKSSYLSEVLHTLLVDPSHSVPTEKRLESWKRFVVNVGAETDLFNFT